MASKSGKQKTKVMVSFGTRPECIKLAPVINRLENQKDKFDLKICSMGQHKEMLDQVISFFKIKPYFSLNLMTENQTLGSLSSKLLSGIDNIFLQVNPDIVLVQGDTTTAFLVAIAAYYKKIKIGHVEAGLRTYNKFNPFPEEINRQLISRIADFNFAPTEKALNNLKAEVIDAKTIFLTGNTIVDAIQWGIGRVEKDKEEIESNELFKKLDYGKKIVLVTMHRRESFGEDIKNACEALKIVSGRYENVQIVYPVHLNPNVKKPVHEILGNIKNITLTNPLSYETFIWLMSKSYFIVTDSGGIQEEAPTLKKPVLVIRKFTERTESLDLGTSKLIGTDIKTIVNNISVLLDHNDKYLEMIPDINPYGDGRASEKIVDIIYNSFKEVK
ncbi:MAG: UDP-N-acetylglucosamine 2-epimerase (non-hydrolyzing) [Actinobacteria bacterium]|nr:UDP-N-acetylglucosamine 2-epimerase (non-hydrolyzing) [Actinomycetota bacterium]